jgi:23S rRNA (cytidine1920-2'-O)/16S rRNA (cytidine1409-2'-O)-methyltransferase
VSKVRLDNLLFEKKIVSSIDKAAALIMAGVVFVDGVKRDKPSFLVENESEILVKENTKYVSRGGLKLEKVKIAFNTNFNNKVVLDIGSSNGGFTDVALQNGALRVHCVDVGKNLLHYRLRLKKEVIIHENLNFRYISFNDIGEKVDIILCDVSFISITKLLDSMLLFCRDGTELIFLIKPQFETEARFVGKNGIIKDFQIHSKVLYKVIKSAYNVGLFFKDITVSPIKGVKGNIEYLVYFLYKLETDVLDDEMLNIIINKKVYENSFNCCKTTC